MNNGTKIILVLIALLGLGGYFLSRSTSEKTMATTSTHVAQTARCPRVASTTVVGNEPDPIYDINSNIVSLQNVVPGTPVTYSFTINDNQNRIIKDFKVEREKLLHLIVVRKDLTEFQHVHPTFDSNSGKFTISDLTFPSAGEYRLFADFAPQCGPIDAEGSPLPLNKSEDIRVKGVYNPITLGADSMTNTIDGYVINLNTKPHPLTKGANMFTFAVSQNGKPVTNLEDYLGALGHAVILKEGTLDYIHTHALEGASSSQNGTINFHVEFPSAGKYKVFMQFQRNGTVETSQFVVSINNVTGGSMEASPSMQHSMHQ